jgi:hypothetical protein
MKFAKWTFRIAGIWGILVLPPLYFVFDDIGRFQPPAITHPEFYYGFVGVTLAWQLAFLVMATDPVRYRPLMIPAMFEKFGYVVALAILHAQGRVPAALLAFSMTDLILGVLFVVSYFRTRRPV